MALPRPAGVIAPVWRELQSALTRVLRLTAAGKASIAVSRDEYSQVNDLAVAEGTPGTADFSFTYRSGADYDQNSEVNIGDLTPIGLYFLAKQGDANWGDAQLADGDHNTEVNIADITPLCVHYLEGIDGYLLESASSASPGDTWTTVSEIPVGLAAEPPGGGRKRIAYSLASAAEAYYRVTPFEGAGLGRTLGLESAAVHFVPSGQGGTLDPPANVSATDGLYIHHIVVKWEKVAGATLYQVFRDDQGAPVAELGDVPSWDDASISDTAPHTYWVRAGNGADLSNFSAPDTGYCAEGTVPGLDPPTGVQASDGTFTDRVQITWTKSSGAVDYKVFRDNQSNLLATTGDLATYDDINLPDALPHTYWVKAINASAEESAFSASDTGWQAELPPVLAPPADVAASDALYTDHIEVSWTKSAGAVDYEVFRDTQANLIGTAGDSAVYHDYGVSDMAAHKYWVKAVDAASVESAFSNGDTGQLRDVMLSSYVVFGYNDLGMHCLNQDFSELMILPPFNTLHAMVIQRGEEPDIRTSGVTVNYSIPSNTYSVGKTNFWDYAADLFGSAPAPNIGLTGHGLSGSMTASGGGRSDWVVTGIPLTPQNDADNIDPYPLATISVVAGGNEVARTQAVTPVSWEISCNYCHAGAGISTATAILRAHDNLHGTTLESMKPVACGMCHPQPELGMAGLPGLPTLSSAMHSAHAPRMGMLGLPVSCYACHPGTKTQCQRDVHYSAGMSCVDCHGNETAVGDPGRVPWTDLPRCDDCHTRSNFEFEQPGTLYRDSRGHRGVMCAACHGSPHAIAPSIKPQDNVQAIGLQGHSGTINTCSVCHMSTPGDPFPHRLSED